MAALRQFEKESVEPSQEEQFIKVCAGKLWAVISKKTWHIRNRKLNSTKSRDVKRLLNNYSQEYITEVLDWYLKNIDANYMIKVHNLSGFANKFSRIEEKMKQDSSLVKISPDAKKVLEDLKYQCFHFRGIAESMLIYVIQQSLDNYVKFRSNLMIAQNTMDHRYNELTNCGRVHPVDIDDDNIRRESKYILRLKDFLDYAKPYFKKPTSFVEEWMKKTSQTIESWHEYEGNLMGFIFAIDHRRFEWMGRQMACAYFGDNGTHYWDKLISYFPK